MEYLLHTPHTFHDIWISLSNDHQGYSHLECNIYPKWSNSLLWNVGTNLSNYMVSLWRQRWQATSKHLNPTTKKDTITFQKTIVLDVLIMEQLQPAQNSSTEGNLCRKSCCLGGSTRATLILFSFQWWYVLKHIVHAQANQAPFYELVDIILRNVVAYNTFLITGSKKNIAFIKMKWENLRIFNHF